MRIPGVHADRGITMRTFISAEDEKGSREQVHANAALPVCPIHPGSFVRRYRTHGANGPGVYPQCVPAAGDRAHLLAWDDAESASAPHSETSDLSLSERAVLIDASNGMTVIETAARHSKSPETVKTQRRSILLKLGARNMAQAVGMMSEGH
jgi:DNA-binding CsgD family transcriptional regulator